MGKQLVMTLIIGTAALIAMAGAAEPGMLPAANASVSTPVTSYLPYVSFQPAWQWQPAGLAGHTVRTFLGSQDATYAGIEPGGVFRAADCALTWQPQGLVDQSVFALAQTANDHLYAGTFGGGVYRSSNSGQTWQSVNSGLGDLRIYGLAAHPTEIIILAAGYENGMYRTTNGGGSWQRSTPNDLNELNAALFDPRQPTMAYAGTYRRGLYRSSDAGTTLAPSSAGLPAQSSVWAIAAVQSSTVTTITLGTSDGVYRSTDDGNHWQSIGLHGQEVRALANDPGDAGHWFAGTRTRGVWETSDGGTTWREISRGLPVQGAVYALRVMPAPCSLLVAGTSAGVYRRPVWLRSTAE